MSSQAAIKRIRALHRKKERKQTDLAIAQGMKVVQELLQSGLEVTEVHVLESEQESFHVSTATQLYTATAKELRKMGTLQTGMSALAVFRQPAHDKPQFDAQSVYIACDTVSDPGNLGTIFRSVEFFGLSGIILGSGCVDVFNPKCVQAAMGSVFRVPYHEMDLSMDLPDELNVYCAEMEGVPFHTISIERPAVIVLGNEGHGIQSVFKDPVSFTIQGNGIAESLNVSMAATAICAEIHRRSLIL